MLSRKEFLRGAALAAFFTVACGNSAPPPPNRIARFVPTPTVEPTPYPTPDPCALNFTSEAKASKGAELAKPEEVAFFQNRLLEHLNPAVDKPFWRILSQQVACGEAKGLTVARNSSPGGGKRADGTTITVQELSSYTYDIKTQDRQIHMVLSLFTDKKTGKITKEDIVCHFDKETKGFTTERSNWENGFFIDIEGKKNILSRIFKDPPKVENILKTPPLNSHGWVKHSEDADKTYIIFNSGKIQLLATYTV